MQQFIMLVGLPGSGKTTFAKQLCLEDIRFREKEANGGICLSTLEYFSSDLIRKELYGDESIQGNAQDVFELMKRRTIEALKSGYSAIYDATGVKRKDRLDILNRVKSLKMDIQCECHIVWARFETCIERNNNRERVVPEEVIWRMAKQFQTPWYDEGWDEIKIVMRDDPYMYDCLHLFENHDNSHHKDDTIYDHINRVMGEVWRGPDHGIITDREDPVTKWTPYRQLAYVHDIGKVYTKDFHNSRGEVTEDAHYYQHQNVGAYMCLGLDKLQDTTGATPLYMSYLTLLHMEPFFDKQPSDYWKKKVDPEIKRLIYIFNECDRKGA